MNMLEKNIEKDCDCRALSKDFLVEFMPEGKFAPFIDLVKKYHDELEICFRGNNAPTEAVCIYYNNHLVYKIESNGNITINFNHARYSTDYKKYWKLINHTYCFNPEAEEKPRVKVTEKESKKEGTKYYTGIGYIVAEYNECIKKNVERIYVDCIRKMLIDSFEVLKRTDYFRATANHYTGYRGKLKQTGKKNGRIEKIRQQQLFAKMKYQKGGYFFYDLEFSQKSMDDSNQYEEALTNEPDMLAIRFDNEGRPEAFAFVEVKCTEKAYHGSSGLVEHLKKMQDYPESYMQGRLREAALIMDQYNKLGIYELEVPVNEASYMSLVDKPAENLFVFSDDDALSQFRKDSSDEIVKFKNKAVQISNIDIHISGCKEIEFWVL